MFKLRYRKYINYQAGGEVQYEVRQQGDPLPSILCFVLVFMARMH